MDDELRTIARDFCAIANTILIDMCMERTENLPFLLFTLADACYIVYDTQEEQVVAINLIMVDHIGICVTVDPISRTITCTVADASNYTIKMATHVANILVACIQQCWSLRLSTDGLITVGDDGRYIAVDLID